MDKAKIFMNGKSQAVRLPKKYRFDSEEVLITEHRLGILLINPKKRWEGIEEVIDEFSDDMFENGRELWPWTEREDL